MTVSSDHFTIHLRSITVFDGTRSSANLVRVDILYDTDRGNGAIGGEGRNYHVGLGLNEGRTDGNAHEPTPRAHHCNEATWEIKKV